MGNESAYREYPPPDPLRAHVRCLWELRAHCDELTPQLVVPDGCMGLVLNFGEPMEQLQDGAPPLPQPSSTLLVGELRRPFVTRSRGRVDLLGVRFRPGAARAFMAASVHEVVDTMSDESSLDARFARRVVRTVRSAEPGDRRHLLETALSEQLVRGSQPRELVQVAVRELVDADGGVEIEALAAKLGVSRRHLERQFGEDVGIAPKSLGQVLRFRRVLRAIEDSSPDWASVAIDCGYSDQSHLIRDFKRFVGLPPRLYLRDEHGLALPRPR
jgi:AraC-like DNA-binding protein